MKKIVILCWVSLLIISLSASPVFPKTNVMEVCIGDTSLLENLNQGFQNLKNKYGDDDLIILNYYSLNSPLGNEMTDMMFTELQAPANKNSVFFNSQARLFGDTPALENGQPIDGEMEFGKFTPSYMYIHNFVFSGENISFQVRKAFRLEENNQIIVDYDFTDHEIYIMVVEKIINNQNQSVVRYIHQELSSFPIQDQQFTYQLPNNFDPLTHKAVVVIKKNNLVVQSASNERNIKPFRIVAETNFSVIVEPDTYMHNFYYFYVVNTQFTSSDIIDVVIDSENLIKTNQLFGTPNFCDAKAGLCPMPPYSVSFDSGDYLQLYASGYPFGNKGFNLFQITVAGEGITEVLPHYLTTEGLDVLVVQDDGKTENGSLLLEHLQALGINYGVFKPSFYLTSQSELITKFFSFSTIIWNASSVYPALARELVYHVAGEMGQETNIVIIGQSIANVLSNNDVSAYYQEIFSGGLENTMRASFQKGTNLQTNITGRINDEDFSFTFNNHHFSTDYLHLVTEGHSLLQDNHQQIKAVYSSTARKTYLLDFDLADINEQEQVVLMLKEILKTVVSEIEQPQEHFHTLLLSTYPNPVRNIMQINLQGEKLSSDQPTYSIYNIKGQKILSGKLVEGNNGYSQSIDFQHIKFHNGIYFIKVNTLHESVVKKMLILK